MHCACQEYRVCRILAKDKNPYISFNGSHWFKPGGVGALLAGLCIVCFAGLVSACGEAPAPRSDAAILEETSAGVVDWHHRVVALHTPGWSVEFCEGEGPFLCVTRGNEPVGSVELFSLPVREHMVISQILGRGGSELEALEASAADFFAVLSADRRIGHGEDYYLQADPPAEVVVMGRPGLHLILEGRIADRVLERIVQFHAIDRDTIYLLAATGIHGGGPLGEFDVEHLKAFEPVFADIAAASRVYPTAP